MSVVIVGGNECMTRQYKDLCDKYDCRAKVFCKLSGLKSRIGSPDLIILFTSTISHKMVHCALSETGGQDVAIERSHSSSMSALRSILEKYTAAKV